ncbi:MAG: L-threonylcarbamoyladenylate synthase [Rhodoluna sp.]|nr:L-threonylcarbamoyladenylate synthase [Rhodoluna sp.]
MGSIFDCSVDTSLLEGMRKAKQALAKGDLVVVPTDTVYGLAADAFSAKAVQALLDAKGRGRQSPPPVLIPNVDSLYALADSVSPTALRLAEKYWPGPLTLILRAQASLQWDLGETKGTVALRVPNHRITLALLAESGPLAVSSANLTGKPAANTVNQAFDYLGDKVAVYLDGGDAELGEASTILDLTGEKIRIVREGVLKRPELAEFLGEELGDE